MIELHRDRGLLFYRLISDTTIIIIIILTDCFFVCSERVATMMPPGLSASTQSVFNETMPPSSKKLLACEVVIQRIGINTLSYWDVLLIDDHQDSSVMGRRGVGLACVSNSRRFFCLLGVHRFELGAWSLATIYVMDKNGK